MKMAREQWSELRELSKNDWAFIDRLRANQPERLGIEICDCVMVPREPTPTMRMAGVEANCAHEKDFPKDNIYRSVRVWRAMLSAAEQPTTAAKPPASS